VLNEVRDEPDIMLELLKKVQKKILTQISVNDSYWNYEVKNPKDAESF
jgi:hypothetical protein